MHSIVLINTKIMINCNPSRLMCGVVRTLSTTTHRCSVNHYDVLGITPKATQGDIKSAYYKLSKVYHPDKANNDEVAAKKFRAISEAYEVLGNLQLKKLYDKGLLGGGMPRVEYRPDPEPTDPTLKFYKSRIHRSAIPTMDGKQPIYDFDTWSKSHYGNLFEKAKYEKEFLKKKRQKAMEVQHANQQEAFLLVMFGLVGLFIFLVARGPSDFDTDRTPYQHNQTDTNTEQ